jgi:glycosyltransferase involved in cell wall biosynthesis
MIKNVLYITNVRLPTQKAHGLQIMKMCEAFARTGLAVRLIVPKLRPHVPQDPFLYYDVRPIFSIDRRFILELLPFISFARSLVSYLQNISFSFFVAIPFLFIKPQSQTIIYSRDFVTLFFLTLFGVRPVAEVHDYRFTQSRWWIHFLLKRCKTIITNSQGTLKALHQHYSNTMVAAQTMVAVNGVDIDTFSKYGTKQEIRNELNLSHDKILIAYIGQLEVAGNEKGVTTLLQAYDQLSPVIEEKTELYIIGGPDEYLINYKTQYPKIHYTGFIALKDSIRYYKAVDIVVIPLPRGRHAATTSPIKLFHALAAGKAIIISDLPELRLILNDANALFAQADNPASFAQKITELVTDPAKITRLGKRAQQDAQQYTWKARAQLIVTFLHNIHEK